MVIGETSLWHFWYKDGLETEFTCKLLRQRRDNGHYLLQIVSSGELMYSSVQEINKEQQPTGNNFPKLDGDQL